MKEYDGFNGLSISLLLRDAAANRGGIASTALTGMLLLAYPQGDRPGIRSAIKNGRASAPVREAVRVGGA